MRAIKFGFAAIVAIIIIVLAVANAGEISVRLWPDLTAYGIPGAPSVVLPIFVVGLLCGLVGFLLGAAREYLREGQVRSEARQNRKEAQKLKSKIDELTADKQDDDIPALPAR